MGKGGHRRGIADSHLKARLDSRQDSFHDPKSAGRDMSTRPNYFHTPATSQAVRALLAQQGSSARALLVTGAPGTGKTALAEAIAREHGGIFVYALLHSWSGADDLFAGVNVPAAVAGDAQSVHQPGVLALAAEASQTHGLVVVCLDELDKAPESVEALLLDWLQSGRVPVRPGVHMQTRLERVIAVITSNGMRPHSDALLRRCRRLRMQPLPADVRVQLAAERAHVPVGIVRLLDRAFSTIEQQTGTVLSLQELSHCASEIWTIATSAADVAEALRAWAVRDDETTDVVSASDISGLVAAIWGETIATRRRSGGF